MSLSRVLSIFAICLFGLIAVIALFKGKRAPQTEGGPIELPAAGEVKVVTDEAPIARAEQQLPPGSPSHQSTLQTETSLARPVPQEDRVNEFFNRGVPQLPIVTTVKYSSRVPWLKGRPAWLYDYAIHYKTSRHFIARSLNGRADYLKQDIAEGDRFNVLNPEKNFHFHLVVDVHNCKMLFYYIDEEAQESHLVKTYNVGLGRVDPSSTSGFLTPLGQFQLGDRTAVYSPKMKGFHNGERVELISVFGTRWIPFECELADCTAPAKGFGIHGVPWVLDPTTGKLQEDTAGIGKHHSDGCVRLATADVEELFSIIISRPTTIELVRNWQDAAVTTQSPTDKKRG